MIGLRDRVGKEFALRPNFLDARPQYLASGSGWEPQMNDDTPIWGYADESSHGNVVVCALAVFSSLVIAEAEDKLAKAKRSVGMSPEALLHCKILFNGDRRRKSEWSNVEPRDIYSMLRRLCIEIKQLAEQPVISFTCRDDIPAELIHPLNESEPVSYKASPFNEKGAISFLYSSIFARASNKYGLGRVRVWIDPDKTKIPWGLQNRRADATRSFFIDLKESGQVVPK